MVVRCLAVATILVIIEAGGTNLPTTKRMHRPLMNCDSSLSVCTPKCTDLCFGYSCSDMKASYGCEKLTSQYNCCKGCTCAPGTFSPEKTGACSGQLSSTPCYTL
eukprot:Sspe_Gene.8105::Locus_2761_Transcript_2_3_Confidence_0.500_Length_382::g.8105::m.8105